MTSAIAPSAPEHWLHSFDIWATTMLMGITATVANKVAAANTERGLMSRPSPLSARGPSLLLSGFYSPLIDHAQSRSSRKHVDQHRQNDEHQNGGEQDASDNDESEWTLNLCADSG